jgi:hypothetical protein
MVKALADRFAEALPNIYEKKSGVMQRMRF